MDWRFLLLGAAVLGTPGAVTSCRKLSVCEAEGSCEPQGSAAAGNGSEQAEAGQGGQREVDSAGAPSGGSEAGAVAGGADAAGGLGGGGASSEPCAADTADCDGSTLTLCETHVDWSVRHCGGCGLGCDGACVLGQCKPSELLQQERYPTRLVASRDFAYALLAGEQTDIVEINLETAASRVVGSGFASDTVLALSPDRLYAFSAGKLKSRDLADGAFASETLTADSVGAATDGLYYTQNVVDSNKVTVGELWLRPTSAGESKRVWKGGALKILASSQYGVVVEQRVSNDSQLLHVNEARVADLGAVPNWASVQVVRNGVAMVVINAALASGYELRWTVSNGGWGPLPLGPEVRDPELAPAPGGVALLLSERGHAFAQLFDADGAVGVPLGLEDYAKLAFVDSRYLWFRARALGANTPSFWRARQLEPTDVQPVD